MFWSRRDTLVALSGFAAGSGAAALGVALAGPEPPVSPGVADSLRTAAKSRGLIYGAAASPHHFDDPAFGAAFARECGVLVPENELKWSALRPAPDLYDFAMADSLLSYAQRNGMAMRGHVLLWHLQLPVWFEHEVAPANVRQHLVDHISAVCRRYAGRMHSWDVVNEAVETAEANVDGLRATPWLDMLGPGYIELAFRTAHAADPAALLVYNDYGLEMDTDWHEARRQRVLRLLRDLREAGAPVHALGVQSHLEAGQASFSPGRFESFLEQVASLGLQILVTELDVIDKHLPADEAIRDAEVARLCADYLTCTLRQPAVRAVLTWGLSDRHTWLNGIDQARRPDGLPVRGLPLDAELRPKAAYHAIRGCLMAAPPRESQAAHRPT